MPASDHAPDSQQAAHDLQRTKWIDACTARLLELRQTDDQRLLVAVAVAVEMWNDVGSFDPFIAAEMEHESWLEPEADF